MCVSINLYAYAYIIYLELRGFLFLDGLEEDWERESMCWRELKEKSWEHTQTFKDVVTIIGVSHPNFDPIPSSYWSMYIYTTYIVVTLPVDGMLGSLIWKYLLIQTIGMPFYNFEHVQCFLSDFHCFRCVQSQLFAISTPTCAGAFYVGNGWVAGGCWDDYW